jgi:hypothetical protein
VYQTNIIACQLKLTRNGTGVSLIAVEQKSEQKQNPTKKENGLDPDPMPIHKGMMFDRRESTNLGDDPSDKN